jgi:dienelactone hydrolase
MLKPLRAASFALVAFACAAKAAAMSLTVSPSVSLADAPVSVAIRGAAPSSQVTIKATTTLFGNTFESHATYRVRPDGTVNLARDPATSGSYTGIHPMGLFWSLRVAGPFRDVPFDALASNTVTFTATDGDRTSSQSIQRLVVAPGVQRADVRETGIFGTSFLHNDDRQRPGVIVLGGSEGGTPDVEAALIASQGFNTVALGYFGVGPLPKALANIPVEGVENAVHWLQRQPHVDGAAIGVVGSSKGAELALLSASILPQIKVVVAEKPSSVIFSGLFYEPVNGQLRSSWMYHGVPVPFVNGTVPSAVSDQINTDEKAKRPVSYTAEYLAWLQNATNSDASTIRVERINGPILLVSGDDDRLWPSSFMAAAIMARLGAKGHPFADKWLHYPGAGHGIGVAYANYTHSTGNDFINLGGSTQANAMASDDSWPQVIAFLRTALSR